MQTLIRNCWNTVQDEKKKTKVSCPPVPASFEIPNRTIWQRASEMSGRTFDRAPRPISTLAAAGYAIRAPRRSRASPSNRRRRRQSASPRQRVVVRRRIIAKTIRYRPDPGNLLLVRMRRMTATLSHRCTGRLAARISFGAGLRRCILAETRFWIESPYFYREGYLRWMLRDISYVLEQSGLVSIYESYDSRASLSRYKIFNIFGNGCGS